MANILLVLGGQWHDFDGFATAMQPILVENGHRLDVTYDFDTLSHINETTYDLLISYTCLTEAPEGRTTESPTRFSDSQIKALMQWVQNGGGLLAVHSATVAGSSSPGLEELLGGAFVSHPEQLIYSVVPLSAPHPITSGIEAFEVCDELYIERYDSSDMIHMVAIYEDIAYPLVWSRLEGQGRVAHIAPGHSSQTWENNTYQRLMLQAIRWLLES